MYKDRERMLENQRKRQRTYKAKHPERIKENYQRYAKYHRDELDARRRRYNASLKLTDCRYPKCTRRVNGQSHFCRVHSMRSYSASKSLYDRTRREIFRRLGINIKNLNLDVFLVFLVAKKAEEVLRGYKPGNKRDSKSSYERVGKGNS